MKRVLRSGQRLLRRAGYEVRPYPEPPPPASPAPQPAWPWIRDTQGIRTVIDIGANNGDFAAFLAKYMGATNTLAFEPLPSCQEELRNKEIPGFRVFDVALSDHDGEETFYVNSYGPASSLLRVSAVSMDEFPQTRGETPTVVRVRRLDDVVDLDPLPRNILIKIDVQGLEDRVIRGGEHVFGAAQVALVEMSFEAIYDGQPLFEEVHDALVRCGLRFAGIKNQVSSRTGQPLFAHCYYVRRPA